MGVWEVLVFSRRGARAGASEVFVLSRRGGVQRRHGHGGVGGAHAQQARGASGVTTGRKAWELLVLSRCGARAGAPRAGGRGLWQLLDIQCMCSVGTGGEQGRGWGVGSGSC